MFKNMKYLLLSLAVALSTLSGIAPAGAQTQQEAAQQTPLYWVIPPTLDRASALRLRLDQITSVSLHTYMLNGRIPITDMLVRTSDGHTVSLYTIREDKINSRDKSTRDYIREYKKNAKDNCEGINVSRHYPGDLSRNLVEFYIANNSKLWDIYDSLNEAISLKRNLQTDL